MASFFSNAIHLCHLSIGTFLFPFSWHQTQLRQARSQKTNLSHSLGSDKNEYANLSAGLNQGGPLLQDPPSITNFVDLIGTLMLDPKNQLQAASGWLRVNHLLNKNPTTGFRSYLRLGVGISAMNNSNIIGRSWEEVPKITPLKAGGGFKTFIGSSGKLSYQLDAEVGTGLFQQITNQLEYGSSSKENVGLNLGMKRHDDLYLGGDVGVHGTTRVHGKNRVIGQVSGYAQIGHALKDARFTEADNPASGHYLKLGANITGYLVRSVHPDCLSLILTIDVEKIPSGGTPELNGRWVPTVGLGIRLSSEDLFPSDN